LASGRATRNKERQETVGAQIMAGLLLSVFASFAINFMYLVGVTWVRTRKNMALRILGIVAAIFFCLRNGEAILTNVSLIQQVGWSWFYVVGLLSASMFTLMFGLVVLGGKLRSWKV